MIYNKRFPFSLLSPASSLSKNREKKEIKIRISPQQEMAKLLLRSESKKKGKKNSRQLFCLRAKKHTKIREGSRFLSLFVSFLRTIPLLSFLCPRRSRSSLTHDTKKRDFWLLFVDFVFATTNGKRERERNVTTLLVVSAFSARDDDDDDDFDEKVLSIIFMWGQKDDERFYRREYAAASAT